MDVTRVGSFPKMKMWRSVKYWWKLLCAGSRSKSRLLNLVVPWEAVFEWIIWVHACLCPQEVAPAHIQRLHHSHVFSCQREIPNIEVLLDSARGDRLCAQGASHLEMPPNDNIGSALPMLRSNLCNVRVLQHFMTSLGNSRGDGTLKSPRTVSRAKGRVSLESNAMELAVISQVLLVQVRVRLVLQDSWLVLLGIEKDLLNLAFVEVGQSDGLGEALVHEGFHGSPGLHIV